MKNFYIEVNGKAIKDYQNFRSAYKEFLIKSRNKDNLVCLYELKSHAFKDIACQNDHYVMIECNR